MAWRSSGNNNTEMVDNLRRNELITNSAIERGFRNVDRKFFVPKGQEEAAHADQPLREGNIHISAPHIYASALEALELKPNSSLSFLNIGSGTGYLSSIVAEILGPNSLNFGVEIHKEVVEHCYQSIDKWKSSRTKSSCGKRHAGSMTIVEGKSTIPHIEIINGNGLQISSTTGETVVGFDRIYIGAAVENVDLPQIKKLLSPGGILVGPVDDELVKVVRIGPISESGTLNLNEDTSTTNNSEESSGKDEHEFTKQVLSGVRFAPLSKLPVIQTIIPAKLWDPSNHSSYPVTFQKSSMALFLCSRANYHQPLRPILPEEQINLAAYLPRDIWVHILSFTHRKWFEPPHTEVEFLKKRLVQEQALTAKAQQARIDAEARIHIAERERDVYRLLARRWQSRLQTVLQQQRQAAAYASDNANTSNTATSFNTNSNIASDLGSIDAIFNGSEAFFGIGSMLQRLQNDREYEEIGTIEDNNEVLSLSYQDSTMDDINPSGMEQEGSGEGARDSDDDEDDDEEYEFHSLHSDASNHEHISSSNASVSVPSVREISLETEDDVVSVTMNDAFSGREAVAQDASYIQGRMIEANERQQTRTISLTSEDL